MSQKLGGGNPLHKLATADGPGIDRNGRSAFPSYVGLVRRDEKSRAPPKMAKNAGLAAKVAAPSPAPFPSAPSPQRPSDGSSLSQGSQPREARREQDLQRLLINVKILHESLRASAAVGADCFDRKLAAELAAEQEGGQEEQGC